MLLIREVMYCKPGKVRPLVEKMIAMSKMMEKQGMGRTKILTDFSAERYWTCVSEFEVESMEAFMNMMSEPTDDAKEMEKLMEGYHDLVDWGKREIYNVEY